MIAVRRELGAKAASPFFSALWNRQVLQEHDIAAFNALTAPAAPASTQSDDGKRDGPPQEFGEPLGHGLEGELRLDAGALGRPGATSAPRSRSAPERS
jgi:hypothetical protein